MSYGRDDKKNLGGGWGSALTQLAAFAGLGKGESHSTAEKYDTHSQAIVPLVQFTFAALLSFVWLGALWFCREPFVALFKAASQIDMFFLVAVFMVLGWAGRLIASHMLTDLGDESVYQAIMLVASFAFQIAFAWTALNIVYALTTDLETIELATLGFCLPVLMLAPLFIIRMGVEVFNPRHPLDPRLKRMDRIIDLMEGGDEEGPEQKPAMLRLIPSSSANGVQATSRTEGYINLHPETIDLVNFIKTAKKLGEKNRSSGLAKSEWLPARKRPFLGKPVRQEWPNPHREYGVTRVGGETYKDLIDLCIQWKFIEPGGGGYAATWIVNPDDALKTLQREIDKQIKGDNSE